ncbi:ubiquinol-cytochrome c reductase subunit 6 [Klebsormidium nitens]|uniref:Cytochrome b-c1 complex subunit 6 n=1 Tax=Klebsormidium nitens TaxID=105231 RepID=A0A0U9HQV4_KLENI|nr:ubiquinol-cytochrome c reductase subunit 6 [Klebsormidium nitens]|eukprot:GAQ81258.1 ubiquinol-cytochrome c reductase subunit 6 [Klebsormidium nitens]
MQLLTALSKKTIHIPCRFTQKMADDEDPVDLKPEIEEDCKPKCAKPLFKYNECKERVEKDTTGEKHCTGQYFDFWSCIDKCAANKTFSHLK